MSHRRAKRIRKAMRATGIAVGQTKYLRHNVRRYIKLAPDCGRSIYQDVKRKAKS